MSAHPATPALENPASECPSEDLLAAFMAGDASDAQRERIERHIDTCPRCAETLRGYVEAFSGSPETEPVPGQSSMGLAALRHRRFGGRYHLRECVGFGSGGTVYAAWDSELDRIVALKVLEVGRGGSTLPDSKWTREAKVMARVVHPNVVAVHDVGIADDCVFIATEFVQGSSLDAWLSAEPRHWSQILDVFVEAGRGLAAIHACGLVHRDFKPHNVMIGLVETATSRKVSRVCVTDFGLARLLPELDEGEDATIEASAPPRLSETLVSRTRTGALVGTPAYMSPEQLRGTPADARSDQFSFCVALYEALWGVRPYEGKVLAELVASVCEGTVRPPPAKPKVPRWLMQAVMRGLSQDPAGRFEDMPALLRALTEAPRRARRRRQTALLLVGFAAVAGGGYAAASLDTESCGDVRSRVSDAWDAPARADVAEALAEAPGVVHREIEATLDAWVESWARQARQACEAAGTGGQLSTRQHRLQQQCLDRRLSELRAAVEVLREPSAELAEHALDVVGTVSSPERCADVDLLETIEPDWGSPENRMLAQQMSGDWDRIAALRAAGRLDEAHALAEDVVARAENNGHHALRAEALVSRGLVESQQRDAQSAEDTLRTGVWAAEASGHLQMAATGWVELVNVLGVLQERPDDGLAAADRASAAAHRSGDPELALQLASNRAVLASVSGQYEEALQQQLEVIERGKEIYGSEHRQVARMHMNLAAVLAHLGRMDEARDHAIEGLRIHRSLYEGPHPATVEMFNTLGALEMHRGDEAAARTAFERGLDMARDALPPDHVTVASLLQNLSQVDLREGDLDAAEQRLREALRIYRAAYGGPHPDIAIALHNLGSIADDKDDRQAAIEAYREALDMRIQTSGPDHPGTANTLHNLGLTLTVTGDLDEGIEYLERAREIRDRAKIDPYRRATTRFMLAKAYAKRGDDEKALTYAEQSAQLLREIQPRHADILAVVETWLREHR